MGTERDVKGAVIHKAEFCRVLGASLKLSVVANGKTQFFQLDRHNLLAMLESGFEALKELEPGWREL